MDVLVKFYYKESVSCNGNGSYEDTVDVSGQEYRWLSWIEYRNLLTKQLKVNIGYVNQENLLIDLTMERVVDPHLIDFIKKRGTKDLNSTRMEISFLESDDQ